MITVFRIVNKFIYYTNLILRNSKIQNRLIFSFIFVSLIPLGLTAYLSYNKSGKAIESKVQTYSTQVMIQLQKNIRAKMEKIEYACDEVYLSKVIQDNVLPYDTMDDQSKMTAMSDVNQYLKMKFSILPDVMVAQIFDNPGNIYNGVVALESYDNNNFITKLRSDQTGLRDTAAPYKGAVFWMLPEYGDTGNNILLIRTINSNLSGRPIGTLIIGLKNSFFSNVFKDMDVGSGSYVFISDSAGRVISSADADISVGAAFANPSLAGMLSHNESTGSHFFNLDFNSNKYLASYDRIYNTDWYIISIVPFKYLNQETRSIGFFILINTVVALLFSIIFTYMISRSISDPLNKLVKGMNRTKSGDFNVFVKDEYNDEIAEVTHNFNSMVLEIKDLLTNSKQKEKQKRNAELRALQAQINPHFLSNTLNTVKWLAEVQKAGNISSLVTSLIHLLQVSIGKGGDLITIKEEVDYLKNYINIQKYRFNDGFDVEFDIEKDIMNCMILKILLQPLVENSLIHGIEPKNRRGFIKVKAYEDSGNIRFIITDDGIGITEDKMSEILNCSNNSDHERFSSIGIRNVDERIKLFFGEQFGVTINSVPNMFTTVEVVIPII